jgi:predicted transcriptional regulator
LRKADIRVEPVDAFFERAQKTAELADKREHIAHSRVVAFEDVEDLLGVLTQQRVLLLKALKKTPGSITALARRLKRDRSAVARDVQVLQRHGVVEISERPLPGHGRQKWVTPVGQDIQLTAHL